MSSRRTMPWFSLVLVLTSLAVTGRSQADRNPNPAVLPPESNPFGRSYGQWGAEWWRWAMAIPAASNPILDPDGSSCGVDQTGPVWFLAGSAGFTANRTCSVPPGKAIFFPIINVLADYPCPPEFGFEPAPGQSLEEFLVGFADFLIDLADDLVVEVDGVALQNLTDYRGASGMITFTGDPSMAAVFDPCITGTPQAGASDGYWVMLAPLTRGMHSVHFSARVDEFGFGVDVTYVLQVGPESRGPVAIASAPAGGAAPSGVNLKAAGARAFAAQHAAATRKGTWGDLKVIYR